MGQALGHEIVAVLAVLAAFFGGMSAGSFLLSDRIERSDKECAENTLDIGGLVLNCPVAWSNQKVLLVRPEDIEVGNYASDKGQALITHRTFLGDRVQLTLNTLSAAGHPIQLRADVGRDHTARLGDTVGIRVQPERLMPSYESL